MTIAVQPEKEAAFDLCVARAGLVPGNSNGRRPVYRGRPAGKGAFSVKVNGAAVEPVISKGYARIGRTWNKDDVVEVTMEMPVRRVRAPKVPADKGLVALERGPLVYAIEPVRRSLFGR